jgi:nucleotide-binding universal stress UspA family protein
VTIAALDMAAPAMVLPFEPARAESAERLADASQRMPVSVTSVVSNRVDAVEAILGEASAHEADVVVIGTRPKGWFARWTARKVAQRVVSNAKRSVLVMPLGALGKDPAPLHASA